MVVFVLEKDYSEDLFNNGIKRRETGGDETTKDEMSLRTIQWK